MKSTAALLGTQGKLAIFDHSVGGSTKQRLPQFPSQRLDFDTLPEEAFEDQIRKSFQSEEEDQFLKKLEEENSKLDQELQTILTTTELPPPRRSQDPRISFGANGNIPGLTPPQPAPQTTLADKIKLQLRESTAKLKRSRRSSARGSESESSCRFAMAPVDAPVSLGLNGAKAMISQSIKTAEKIIRQGKKKLSKKRRKRTGSRSYKKHSLGPRNGLFPHKGSTLVATSRGTVGPTSATRRPRDLRGARSGRSKQKSKSRTHRERRRREKSSKSKSRSPSSVSKTHFSPKNYFQKLNTAKGKARLRSARALEFAAADSSSDELFELTKENQAALWTREKRSPRGLGSASSRKRKSRSGRKKSLSAKRHSGAGRALRSIGREKLLR